MRLSEVMLTNTSQYWEVAGPATRADAWFGNTDGLHTVSVHYTNFVGRFAIQGSLVEEPTEADWFAIGLNALDGTAIGPETEYPKVPGSPTGSNGGDTGADAFSFVGNFTYLRALLVRDYLGTAPDTPEQLDQLDVGAIDKALLSL